MEAEAFPIRFTQGVRAYWRRRKYHRLAEDGGTKPRSRSRQLGSPSGGGARMRRRVRVLLAGPRRALARARDAYVGGMLALAKRASALALPGAVEALWTKRVPRRKQGQLPAPGSGKPTEFEQRLIFEIYKSIVASKELTTMLHSSAAPLAQLKEKLAASAPDGRVPAAALAEALQIPQEQAALALGTLAAVLPAEDPALGDGAVDGAAADIRDVLLFLYIQSYKRLVPRSAHKDSPAVADVWPSTSAFDGYLSALSPIQLVRSNSRRFMPSQADEEIHQLSYLQKHMANILTLLADSVEGEGDDSLVLTMETFEHLGFLVQFSEGTSLSQAATFFANSDPDMPAAPVPAAQVLDWMSQNIASSLEYSAERSAAKESNLQTMSDLDVTMAEANTSHPRNSTPSANPAYYRNVTFVEGFSKTSVVKHASDVKGNSIKVLNCHDSVIYILAPLKYATVYGCSDATVVLGAVGKVVKVEHCERVHIIAAAKQICIANCRECIFYLGVNHRPLVLGDNHKLQVAPFNTCYPQLQDHMMQVGVDPSINKWDQPFVLGVVDPHDSLSHPAGVSDVKAESATCLDPDLFTNFLIPSWFGDERQEPTNCNPFPLPEIYGAFQSKKCSALEDIQKMIRELQLDENRKRELATALHAQFKDWLYASGNIRQLYCLQGD